MQCLFLANIFLAIGIVTSKLALNHLSPIFFVATRMIMPGLALFSFYWAKQRQTFLQKCWHNKRILTFMILVTTLLPLVLKNYALQKISATRFVLLCSIDPFVAMFWECLFFKQEKLFAQKILASAIAFFGIVIMNFDFKSFSITGFSSPDIFTILSVFFAKLGWILNSKSDHFSGNELNAIVMLGCGSAGLITSFFVEPVNLKFLQINVLKYIVISGLFYSLGYNFFSESLKKYSFTFASIFSCLIPFFVAIISFVFFKQPFLINHILAMCIIFVSIMIFHLPIKEVSIISSAKNNLLN